MREYGMVWSIEPSPSNGIKESEVLLSFVEFSHYTVAEYSDKSAVHPSFNVLQKRKLR
jgi:hypothetical protein